MSLINSAAEVWIVAAGESKADAVTKIIEGDLSIPASYVRGNSHTRLIVDTEAFFFRVISPEICLNSKVKRTLI